MIKNVGFVVGAVVAMAGCPKKTPVTSGGGGETTVAPTGAPAVVFGSNMAEAPLYHAGATITGAVPCMQGPGTGYAKFDFPVGQALKMNVAIDAPPGACVSISYLKANGGAVDGMMKEMCVDKSANETWDIQGLEGGSFIQLHEAPPCKGASITITAQ